MPRAVMEYVKLSSHRQEVQVVGRGNNDTQDFTTKERRCETG